MASSKGKSEGCHCGNYRKKTCERDVGELVEVMEACKSCGKELPLDHVLCSANACKLHFSCAGIKEITWRKADKTAWKCHDCRKTLPPGQPVSAEELRMFMNQVNAKLSPVGQIQEISNNVKELKQSVDFMSTKYDELMNRIQEIEQEREEQKKLVEEFKNKLEAKEKIIESLQMRMRETEQYSRNRNIEISGVEVTRGENLIQVMGSIANKIGVDFDAEDVDVIHRVPTRRGDEPPKIIAQFLSRKKRNNWLKNKKNARMLSKEVVSQGKSDNLIFLNTHLTFEWKQLLWQAKQHGRPKGYRIIWYQDSKIYAKKDLTDVRALIITSEKDLQLFG